MSAQSLSPDVLHLVFDQVTFDDLFYATHVSRTWRATACGHPRYWKWLTMVDSSCTPGGLALFDQRLNASAASATIQLEVHLSSPAEDLARLLLKSLLSHIHKIEDLTLTLSAQVTTFFRDLFLCSAPCLRILCVIIAPYDEHLEPLRSMFNLHDQTIVEHVTLIDVPLGSDLRPISPVLKTLSVFYFDCTPSWIHRVVSWLPHAELLVIASPRRALPTTSLQAMPSLRHLSLLCEDWPSIIQALCPANQLLSVGVGAPYPTLDEVADILPTYDAICMCIKTQLPRDIRIGQTEWGAVAVCTPDRTVTRLFHHIDISYMASERFLNHVIPFNRLVTLVISLSFGFIGICIGGHTFPQLATLCLGIRGLYREMCDWDYGTVRCPVLRTLAFQSEKEARPTIRAIDAQNFIERTLNRTNKTELRIVLRDVVMDGPWPTPDAGIIIMHKAPDVAWLHDSGMNWSEDVPLRTDWMDIV